MHGLEPRKKRGPSTSGLWTRPTAATPSTRCTTVSSLTRARATTVAAVPTIAVVMLVLSTSKHRQQEQQQQQQARGDWDHYTLRAVATAIVINPSWGPAAGFHKLFFLVVSVSECPSSTATAISHSKLLKQPISVAVQS